jgi:hypothetical protein|tara:strand:+ start:1674 stop:2072 length:399 start_codon:yes stop_codon:yes gene_type:complete
MNKKTKHSKPFSLRSGNTPPFKMMAGSSPYKEMVEKPIEGDPNLKIAAEIDATKNDADGIKEGLGMPMNAKLKAGFKKGASTLVGAFTSGLDAVYGSGKVMPGESKVIFSDGKDKKSNNEDGEDEVDEEINS